MILIFFTIDHLMLEVPKTPLEFLTVCLPMMNSTAIQVFIIAFDLFMHKNNKCPKSQTHFYTFPVSTLLFVIKQQTLSTTLRNGIKTKKEEVWVSHVFCAAAALLKDKCIVECELTVGAEDKNKDTGEDKHKDTKGKHEDEDDEGDADEQRI